MTPEVLEQFRTRVDRGIAKDKLYHPQAERSMKRYAMALTPAPGVDEFDPLLDYSHVEGRKAQLYHRTPEINLLPVDPQDPQIPAHLVLPLREKVLNHLLGPEAAHAKRALHKTLVDTLAGGGFIILKLGHEQVTLPTTTTRPGMLGMPPETVTVNVPIWSRRYVESVSFKRLVIPSDFRDTDFDKAPWLAVRGCIPVPTAKRLGWTLPDGYGGTSYDPSELYYDDGSGSMDKDAIDPQVEFTEIWYKASLYDPAVFNPDLYRCLILVKSSEVPAWHVDSPYQSLDPQGSLTDDSMIGNPIHVDTLRDMPDTAHVPSDLVIGERLSVELTKFRTGLMRNRRGRRPVTLVSDALGQPLIEKIAINDGPIAVPSEHIGEGGTQRVIAIAQAGTEPRDNYTAQEIIQHDWDNAMGSSANQRGQFKQGKTTATEARLVQGNSGARARTDEDRVREYVVRLIRKFDAIVQRTMTPQELTKILGIQGAALWQQWRALPGKYAYKIQPDSGRYVDADEYRTQKVNEYNLIRKDPLINAAELTRSVVTALGYDAGKMVPQDAVKEKPEPPKTSFSLSLDQAQPVPMQVAITMWEQDGYIFPQELKDALMVQATVNQGMQELEQQQASQSPEHGGPASKTERIDKRSSDRTGGLEGVGRVA